MWSLAWARLAPWVLLLASNVFMTTAWYWHLKFRTWPIVPVILISWVIAGAEYAIAVPANRIGAAVYSPAQLKTIQELITLIVFVVFSAVYLGQPVRWSTVGGFALIFAGAGLVYFGRS